MNKMSAITVNSIVSSRLVSKIWRRLKFALGGLILFLIIPLAVEGIAKQSFYLTMRDRVKIAIDLYLP